MRSARFKPQVRGKSIHLPSVMLWISSTVIPAAELGVGMVVGFVILLLNVCCVMRASCRWLEMFVRLYL